MLTKEKMNRFFWQNIYPFLIGLSSVIIASLVFNQMMKENRVSAPSGFIIFTLIPITLLILFIYLLNSPRFSFIQAIGIIMGMLYCFVFLI